MMNQAERLMQIIDSMKLGQTLQEASNARRKTAKVITVTSGKGGVGKTSITVNLAIALSEMGKRVTILDVDFGLANIDVMLGIVSKYSLADVIYENMNILDVLTNGPKNIKFLSGGSGIEELVKLDEAQIGKFLNNIGLLDTLSDVILIDTGAGLSDSVMSFVMAADEVVLVTTPEPTSITDAYALIKMVANRDRLKKIKVIINRAESEKEANGILNRLSVVTNRFLGVNLESLGFLYYDEMVIKAVKTQQPFTISCPRGQAAKHIRDISSKLMNVKDIGTENEATGLKGFVSKFVGFLKA